MLRRLLLIFLLLIVTPAHAAQLEFRVAGATLMLEGSDLRCVRQRFVHGGEPGVEIRLGKSASKRLFDLTSKNVSKRMELLKGQRVIQSAIVVQPIADGVLVISGGISLAEASALVKEIGERRDGCSSP